MKEKQCGKVAKYQVEFLFGAKMYMCTRHFSKPDVQYIITIKRAVYERLEDGDAKCDAEVGQAARVKLVRRKDAQEDKG